MNIENTRATFKFLCTRLVNDHDIAQFLTLLQRGGGIVPMARKFRDSSNCEEFGALALFDFSSFIITVPLRPVSEKLDHPGRNES